MLTSLFIPILFIGLSFAVNRPTGVPIRAEVLVQLQNNVHIVDLRSEEARELDGFIEGALLIPNPDQISKEIEQELNYLKGEIVVYAVDGGREAAKEAEKVLRNHGITNLRCYLDGIKNWIKAGGKIEFPRFIKFNALQKSLERDSILLIDVRNRTELNQVGQIPGSVCLPLHEVDLGFELGNTEFLERYGFLRPDSKTRNVVLTCRSGRRVLVADRILKSKGYQNLRIYSGSFKDWLKNNGTVITGQFDLDYDILI